MRAIEAIYNVVILILFMLFVLSPFWGPMLFIYLMR